MRRALFAGAVGTLAVAALGPLERRLLGRPPQFAPEALARNLAEHQLGLRLSNRAARRAGVAMRALYGPCAGAVLALFPRAVKERPLVAGLALGVLVDAFEERAFPLAGAAAPPRKWSPDERGLLRAQTAIFGLTAAAVHARFTRRARG